MGFGSFTILFGYLGYIALFIPIGIVGLVVFIYDLATYGYLSIIRHISA